MCGVAGVLALDGAGVDDEVGESLSRALAHRGPDGEGRYVAKDRGFLMVHRRLALIDLSPGGAQPQHTPDGRHSISFNGEIYNYRGLRRELEEAGERFHTQSDTEVLLRLVARSGVEGLGRLRGMFAFALWDNERHELLLARDRFGIKPLYYARSAARVAFASEVRALRQSRLATGEPSGEGILAFLQWGSIPPPWTHVEGVVALRPGCWARFGAAGGVVEGRFADVRAPYVRRAGAPVEEEELRRRVGSVVEESVAAHLVADVPVALFLSGGIDSSAILSAASSSGAGNLEAFTVTFRGEGSEERFARDVAARFGARHHVVEVGAGELDAQLPRILDHMDVPSADGVNSWFVCGAVAARGVKAALSGTGGDELFGGYPSFHRVPSALRFGRSFPALQRMLGPLAGRALPAWRRAKLSHLSRHPGGALAAYRAQRGLFMPEELPGLLGPAVRERLDEGLRRSLAADEDRLGPAGEECDVASVARMETCHYLGAQLLRDIDAMSMAHSLEVRVPLVDAEAQGAVWPAVCDRPALLRNKRLLFETLRAPLPPESFDRPKQGFTLPFADWLRGGRLEVHAEGLRTLERTQLLRPGAVDALRRDWERGAAHWSRLWALGVLGHMMSSVGN